MAGDAGSRLDPEAPFSHGLGHEGEQRTGGATTDALARADLRPESDSPRGLGLGDAGEVLDQIRALAVPQPLGQSIGAELPARTLLGLGCGDHSEGIDKTPESFDLDQKSSDPVVGDHAEGPRRCGGRRSAQQPGGCIHDLE